MASKPPESPSGSPAKKKRIVALVEIGMESAEGGRGQGPPRMARLMEESEEEQEEEQPEYSPPPISSLSSSPSTHALTRTTLASPPSNLVVRAVFIEDTGCFHVVECSSCSGVFQAASARKHACNAKSAQRLTVYLCCSYLFSIPLGWLAKAATNWQSHLKDYSFAVATVAKFFLLNVNLQSTKERTIFAKLLETRFSLLSS